MTDIGDMGILTGRTIVSAVRPPYTYGNEFVYQFLFVLRVCWFPMILASVAFSYGPSGVQAAGFLNLFGALDRLGGLFVLAVVREFAPLVCAIVMAGVAGTAITADLGARKIREELDAMEVLGISVIQRLVVPRVLAIAFIAVFLNGVATLVGVMGGYSFNVLVQGGSPGAYVHAFTALAQLPDLYIGEVKAFVFGIVAGIVACHQGIKAKGGPQGVGNGVNQSVVISFVLLFVVNTILTVVYYQIVPPKGL